MLLATMISGIFTTEMGVFIPPLILGVLYILNIIRKKKIRNVKNVACCLVPNIIIGMLYLFM